MTDRRWVIVGAILIQMCLGAIYAWSVFTTPLKDAGWSVSETQYVFTAGLIMFALTMVGAGKLHLKPRTLSLMGGLILGLGYISVGLFGATNFWVVFYGIGILGGVGIGFAYIVPIAVGQKWFPDKPGLITGLAVAGFGFGAMLWVKLAGSWGHLIVDLGLGPTFIIYGFLFAFFVSLGSIWMVMPKEGWLPLGYVMPEIEKKVGMTSSEMIKTLSFYAIALTFMISAGSGLMTIGLMKLFPSQELVSNGFSVLEASAIAGTAMAVFFSLANGIGRIAWGYISDKAGWMFAIITMLIVQGIAITAFPFIAGYEYALYIGAAIIGFNFGGNFSLFPVITSKVFGAKHIAENYGWVFLAYGLGGVFGPILGGVLGDMGNYVYAFAICGQACIVAAGVITLAQRFSAISSRKI